ncbi:MAG: S8 family serine peptidase [Bacteroidales bacterium]|jgi:subtilisin family serine protease|nr:S8 family serine peptidase [Bacteroidales bacterium]
MKKFLLVAFAALLIIAGSCEREREPSLPQDDDSLVSFSDGDIIPGQYVVLLKDGTTSIKSAKLGYADAQVAMLGEIPKILQVSGIVARKPIQVYTASQEGFALKLSADEAAALEKNPGVLGVWPDRMVVLAKPVKPPVTPTGQTTPPGITRVGGGANYTSGKKAWIIDTGIDLNHPDLNVDDASGKTFVARTTSPEDDNGHGTHCAGIVAAINNDIGVVGVAAGAAVVPIKVLDKRGSGAYSVIIAGIDYVVANATAGDAVNMSLGGSIYDPIDLAVIAMGKKGLFVALAAGNESDDAENHSPARAEGVNIYTISACDSEDKWAYFSNYGSHVDYCAPGVSIFSTYKGDSYTTMSGTSMAAPHACGVLLVTGGNPKSSGYVISDPDGNPDPIIHN